MIKALWKLERLLGISIMQTTPIDLQMDELLVTMHIDKRFNEIIFAIL